MVTSFGYAYQQLTCADVPLFKDLLQVLGGAFDEVDAYRHSVPCDNCLTGLLSKQHFIAVVAMKSNKTKIKG
jgi:hypothetical protein